MDPVQPSNPTNPSENNEQPAPQPAPQEQAASAEPVQPEAVTQPAAEAASVEEPVAETAAPTLPTEAANPETTPAEAVSSEAPQTDVPSEAAPAEPAQAAAQAPAATVASPPEPTEAQPAIVVGGADNASATPLPSTATAAAVPVGGRKVGKGLIVGVAAIVLLAGGAAAYYFGYKMNPSTVYSQSLSNTGKGYDQLVSYLDKQSQAGYKGMSGSGTYALDAGYFKTDGKMTYASNGGNSDTTLDVGYGTGRATIDFRTIKSIGDTPDYYLKVGGLGGLSDALSADGVDLSKIDNKWVVVDHTLADNLANHLLVNDGSSKKGNVNLPTEAEVVDAARAMGQVNKDYVFTTDKSKAVFERTGKAVKEDVDGHSTFHYTAHPVKANVKAYIKAEHDALMGSKMGQWIRDNNFTDTVNNSFDDAQKSADTIKDSDTFDIWSDINTRMIYKVRQADAKDGAHNYADIGLDYTGGSSYPFFVSGMTKTGNNTSKVLLKLTLDSKNNSVAAKVDVSDSGDSNDSFKVDANFAPTNKPQTIAKPDNALQLADALDQMGLKSLYDTYVNNALQQ